MAWRRSTDPLDRAVAAFVQLARAEVTVEERRRDLTAALEAMPAEQFGAYAERTEVWRHSLKEASAHA